MMRTLKRISLSKTKGHQLLDAAETGNVVVVAQVVMNGADVKYANGRGVTALHIAAERGHLDLCKYLLKNRADVNALTKKKLTPSMTAAASGHLDVCLYFFQQGATWERAEASLSLLAAVRLRHQGLCEFLLDDVHADVNASDAEGNSALHHAATFTRRELFLLSMASRSRQSRERRVDKAREEQERLEICRLLIERGARLDATSLDGATPLLRCASHAPLCELLLLHGATATARGGPRDETPLHVAGGNANSVTMLLAYGADPHALNGLGQTPLHAASNDDVGNPAAVKLLLTAGARATLKDVDGCSALHMAATRLHSRICRQLLKHGEADPNAQDLEGDTPVMLAVQQYTPASDTKRILRVRNVLVAHGALLSLKNYQGKTLKQLAKEKGFPLITQLTSLDVVQATGDRSSVGRARMGSMGSGSAASGDGLSQSFFSDAGSETGPASAPANTGPEYTAIVHKLPVPARRRNGSAVSALGPARAAAKPGTRSSVRSSRSAGPAPARRSKQRVAVNSNAQEDLLFLLRTVQLEQYLGALHSLGATRVHHLRDITEGDLDEMGLKKLEKRRFRQVVRGVRSADED